MQVMQVRQCATEADLLAQFSSTKALKKAGFTDEQLSQIRFSRKYRAEPIDDWPLLMPDTSLAVQRHDMLYHARQFAYYRYAIVEGPKEAGNQVARAFELCALAEIAPLVEQGRNHAAAQKKKAQNERGFVHELDMTMKKFIIAFHRRPNMRDLTMKERWPEFFGTLRACGLNMRDCGELYKYDYRAKKEHDSNDRNYKNISYRTFKRYGGKAHQPT